MAPPLIRLHNDGTVSWCRDGQVGSGSLAEAAAVLAGGRALALVPSRDVVLRVLSLPPASRRQLLRAVPYAVEDEVCGPVGELSFAVGSEVGQGRRLVAWVNREVLSGWREDLRRAGIKARLLVPDCLALPWEPGSLSLLLDNGEVLVRCDAVNGYAVEMENLAPVVEAEVRQRGIQRLVCFGHEQEMDDLVRQLDPLSCEIETRPFLGAAVSVLSLDDAGVIDMGALDDRRDNHWPLLWKRWRLPLYLLLFCAVLFASGEGIRYSRLQRHLRQDREEIARIYRQAFPKSRHLVNPVAQMRRKLQEMTGARNTFTQLVNELTAIPTLSKGNAKEIRFAEGRLELDMTVPDLRLIDRIRQEAAALAGAAARLENIRAGGKEVSCTLVLEGKR